MSQSTSLAEIQTQLQTILTQLSQMDVEVEMEVPLTETPVQVVADQVWKYLDFKKWKDQGADPNQALRVKELILSNKNLTVLPSEIVYFKQLHRLDLYTNQLTSLPDNLPKQIEKLYCNQNQLTSLPDHLPENLLELHCYQNQLTSLPDNLPEQLEVLYCGYNKLTNLPDHLPVHLRELCCYQNQLTNLPNHLPEHLKVLYCWGNQLTNLPDHLPVQLRELSCRVNQLTNLPDHLPEHLEVLSCGHNQLRNLPPNLSQLQHLQYIYLKGNPLKTIPTGLTCQIDPEEFRRLPSILPEDLIQTVNNLSQKMDQLAQTVTQMQEQLKSIREGEDFTLVSG